METNAAATVRATVIERLLDESDAKLTIDQVNDDTSLQRDLALGSLQAVSLMLDLEDAFHITVETDELTSLKTVGDLLRMIETKVAAQSV